MGYDVILHVDRSDITPVIETLENNGFSVDSTDLDSEYDVTHEGDL